MQSEAMGVRVRKLEWVKHLTAEAWRADTMLGTYQVWIGSLSTSWQFDSLLGEHINKPAEGPDAAKAAAQADYERRILAAIEPSPAPEAVAWQDRDDDMTAAIFASHPVKSKRFDTYNRAQELVGNRHSKGALVSLVNHLLILAETASPPTPAKVADTVREALLPILADLQQGFRDRDIEAAADRILAAIAGRSALEDGRHE